MDDDESIRQDLHIDIVNGNSVSSTDFKKRFFTLLILVLVFVVMVCGATFAVIVLQRGKEIENRVNSHEIQLQLVKKFTEKILHAKSNSSSTSKAVIDSRSEARKYGSPTLRYTSKKVQYLFTLGILLGYS